MGMSLRKTVFLILVALLPAWGSSVHAAPLDQLVHLKMKDRQDARSLRQERRQKRTQKQKPDQKPDRKQGPEQQGNKPDQRRVRRPDDKKGDDMARKGEKPQIKEVPKSIHKLKPKSVTEKVRIRRPPVKVKPKGMFIVN